MQFGDDLPGLTRDVLEMQLDFCI